MSHIEHINISELENAIQELRDTLEYVKEYGYVGTFELSPEQIKEKTDNAIEQVLQGNDWLSEISQSIRDSFEH